MQYFEMLGDGDETQFEVFGHLTQGTSNSILKSFVIPRLNGTEYRAVETALADAPED